MGMFGNPGNGAGFPGGYGNFGAPAQFPAVANTGTDNAAQAPTAAAPGTNALPDMARVRFASQLAQLSAMGFCNEAAALRALQQHQGRVDAAIDTLLSEGSS